MGTTHSIFPALRRTLPALMPASARRIVLLLLAIAAVYLAGNARMSLWDRDEPRYAQCSRQMLQSGDWVVPRLYDAPRINKPPLIYWCQAAAMRVFGAEGDAGAFAARFPSSLAMLCTLAILAVVITRQVGADQAFWTVLVLASSGLAIMSAKVCLTDGVLLLFTIIAQLCLFAIWRGSRSWGVVILLAAALGLGVLTKGPFIVGVVACTAAALVALHYLDLFVERREAKGNGRVLMPVGAVANEMGVAALGPDAPPPGRAVLQSRGTGLPPGVSSTARKGGATVLLAQILLGLLIIAAIVVPWVLLVQHREPTFLGQMYHEGKSHLEEGKEGHHFPPGYHLVLVWLDFMPWSLLLPMAIGIAIRNRRVPQVRFALAAVIGPWVMVEFIGTKLPHYLLPALPPLAFLAAWAIRDCISGTAKDMQSRLFLIGTGIWALVVACVGVLPWLTVRTFRPQPWGAMVALTLVAVVLAAGVFWLFRIRRAGPALGAMGFGMLVLCAVVCTQFFPNAAYLCLSKRVADDLIKAGATHPGDAYMVDYKEPSLAFYQGGTLREHRREFLAPKHRQEWPHWLAVTAEAWNEAVPDIRSEYHEIAREKGWAYSDNNRVVEILVVERKSQVK
ncbi:MAG: arnT [Phycisphaerales bacterium]|nr:arnT [Phycisphaerales bacterium]